MVEDETIASFNAKLKTANQAFQLDKKYSYEKLVSKTFISLLRRFDAKVVAIEKACDITTMRLDDLMESLQVYEMNMRTRKGEKLFGFEIQDKDCEGMR